MNDRVSIPITVSWLRSPTLGICVFFVIACAGAALSQDLTGTWRADDGATYQVRHTGNELFWHGRDPGGGSEWSHVFHATQQGSNLRGRWADVPPGRLRNHGQLEIVIRNADRMDAVTLNGEPYRRTWTRVGAVGSLPAAGGADRGLPPATPGIPSVEASWSSNASAHRGRNGERFNYRCPAGGSPGTVYGTDVYTDDSALCVAAVHAGAITLREGGTITIEILPGKEAYPGSDRNGVATRSWSSYVGSFRVVGGSATGSQVVQREIFVQLPPPTPGLPVIEASWSSNASAHRGRNGERFNYRCPVGGSPGTAYGTDVYTDDSALCVAAVHAGAITYRDGGTITIEILPGQESYPGSDRNGVVTNTWSSYVGSFRVVAASGGSLSNVGSGRGRDAGSEPSTGGGATRSPPVAMDTDTGANASAPSDAVLSGGGGAAATGVGGTPLPPIGPGPDSRPGMAPRFEIADVDVVYQPWSREIRLAGRQRFVSSGEPLPAFDPDFGVRCGPPRLRWTFTVANVGGPVPPAHQEPFWNARGDDEPLVILHAEFLSAAEVEAGAPRQQVEPIRLTKSMLERPLLVLTAESWAPDSTKGLATPLVVRARLGNLMLPSGWILDEVQPIEKTLAFEGPDIYPTGGRIARTPSAGERHHGGFVKVGGVSYPGALISVRVTVGANEGSGIFVVLRGSANADGGFVNLNDGESRLSQTANWSDVRACAALRCPADQVDENRDILDLNKTNDCGEFAAAASGEAVLW
jgi:hypothetical protein